MDFEDQEEHDEEIVLPPSYDSLGNSGRAKLPSPISVDAPSSTAARKPRYRECLKNHAVGIGGQAVDGCGEFMAAGAEGSLDALKCAACNCHRNFHRKETEGGGGGGGFNVPQLLTYPHHHNHNHNHNHHPHHQQFSPTFYRSTSGYLHVAHHQRPLALPSTSGGGGGGGGGGGSQGGGGEEEEDMLSNPSNNNNMSNIMSRKRHRTKFTQEQKEKMMCLAEKLGWRIQKEDDALIQQFSDETGVKRHVLKVWMHNNKHTLGAKKP